MRSDLAAALGEGRGVTAKIRWLTKADEEGEGEGRPRWIHCTPLLGHSGTVGVWMIVLVDEEGSSHGSTGRRFRPAPPVAAAINGRDCEVQASRSRERKQLNAYDKDGERRGGGEREHVRSSSKPANSRNNSHVASQADRNRPSVGGRTQTASSVDQSEFSFGMRTPNEGANSRSGMFSS